VHCDRHVEDIGEIRDLHPLAQAADLRDVGRDDVEGSLGQQSASTVGPIDVLAGGDRRPRRLGNLTLDVVVLRRDWVLQPPDIVGFERLGQSARTPRGVRPVTVEGDIGTVADRRRDCFDDIRLVLDFLWPQMTVWAVDSRSRRHVEVEFQRVVAQFPDDALGLGGVRGGFGLLAGWQSQ